MTENVKIEVDLVTGKLNLECPESSVDSILTRLADFLPKFRDHSQAPRHAVHQTERIEKESLPPQNQGKTSNGSTEGGARKRGSGAARPTTSLDARQEVQDLQLRVDNPGLVIWGTLDKDWKKFLWILEAAREKGIDGLSNSEISYLMDKTFRESRSPKTVNNLRQKIKDRFVQPLTIDVSGKSYAVWRILADGSKEVVQQAETAKA